VATQPLNTIKRLPAWAGSLLTWPRRELGGRNITELRSNDAVRRPPIIMQGLGRVGACLLTPEPFVENDPDRGRSAGSQLGQLHSSSSSGAAVVFRMLTVLVKCRGEPVTGSVRRRLEAATGHHLELESTRSHAGASSGSSLLCPRCLRWAYHHPRYRLRIALVQDLGHG
jgi:hypothetical protein